MGGASAVGAHRDDQALFGIVQGGVDEAMRAESAQRTVALDFDGYGIGGLSVGETRAEMLRRSPQRSRTSRRIVRGTSWASVIPLVDRGRGARGGPVRLRDADPHRAPRHGPDERRQAPRQERQARSLRRTPGPPARARSARDTPAATSATCSRSANRRQRACLSLHNVAWTLALMDRMRAAIQDGTFTALRAEVLGVWGVSAG